jgi:dihydrofolate reductase
MGRVTYEQLFANWGPTAGNPYIDRINAMPKYVASRSLTRAAWNAPLLGPSPSSAIAQLKDQPARTSSSTAPAVSTTCWCEIT